MSDITFTGNKKLKSIAKEWSTKFPYLYLRFFNPDGSVVSDWGQTHASVRGKKGATDLSTNAGMKVGTFEARYLDAFGSRVEIMYEKNGRKYQSLEDANQMSLNEYNAWVKAHGGSDILKDHADWF